MNNNFITEIQDIYGPPPEPVPVVKSSLLSIILIAVTPIALIVGLVIYLKKRKKNSN